MRNQFSVHFNLVQSKIITEAEYTSLKLYLRHYHTPNYQGNVGDIFDLGYVAEIHNDIKDGAEIQFLAGYEVVKNLLNSGIAFIEVK